VAIALAYDYIKRMDIERGEYYVILLFSISGMLLMSQANDLIVVFLALELLSIPLYVLAGFARPQVESEEAALKYFLMVRLQVRLWSLGWHWFLVPPVQPTWARLSQPSIRRLPIFPC